MPNWACRSGFALQRNKLPVGLFPVMKYREVDYIIEQGLGQQVWKWSVKLDADRSATGHEMTKAEAVRQAERAIDRALRLRLVLPHGGE